MLRLATQALQEASRGGAALPLFLALPELSMKGEDIISATFLEHLATQAGVELNLPQSRVFHQGRAGGLVAVANACQALRSGRFRTVLVGGVDTYLDLQLLAGLGMEGRLLVEGAFDGFIPGEGAAFLLLGVPGEARRQKRVPLAHLLGIGIGKEEGHLYSDAPYRGEGLAQAFHQLFASLSTDTPRIRCVYAGLNGENFWAKEWGVAYLRHRQHFEEYLRVEHPIELTGDSGAAVGTTMTGLAALGLYKGYRQGPILVWSSSDREARAAVLLRGAHRA
jgi:3-oxoacyl-[acyl-carrier-protein] synthase-1